MKQTMGERISEFRKDRGMTQDGLAEKVGVTSQAVSKWENNLSVPDLSILIELADLFNVTLDELVRDKEETVRLVPAEKRKNIDELILRIRVLSSDGDKVKVNLPLALVKMAIEMGIELPQISGQKGLKELDLEKIMTLVENGVLGKLVEVESAEGDTVEIVVE